MIERFLKQTTFTSFEDYNEHLQFKIPERFNFAYDVIDAWAEEEPDKLAILWTNDEGAERRTTFGELRPTRLRPTCKASGLATVTP